MASKSNTSVPPWSNMDPKPQVVCVFCGSSPGTDPAYMEAARELAKCFHQHNIKLVYGGGTTGMMGEVAKTLVSLSGKDAVYGIIPTPLLLKEREKYANGADMDRQKIINADIYGPTLEVPDMHVRKHTMEAEVEKGGPGSGFVALPGGWGTMEEMNEMITWNQLGIHALPVVAFSVKGFWNGTMQQVADAVEAGFITQANKDILVHAKTAEEVIQRLRDYRASKDRLNLPWVEKKG